MRKILSVFLILGFVAGLSSCASVQKKFTRKKKEPKHVAAQVYFEEGPFQKKFSNDYYYKTHFTYWKTWHSDLLNQMGGNQKKVARCAQEASSNLIEMSRYLKPEKEAELKPLLDSYVGVTRKLETEAYSESSQALSRGELERLGRIITSNYYYDKVSKDVLPDTVDLGSGTTA
ncbi:MAG TPA: hypothetical protein VD883_03675 [Candidatus Omnitrophota bacterium]|nr:hypothetical protein [Candidatus Omnitrophota bacterium]